MEDRVEETQLVTRRIAPNEKVDGVGLRGPGAADSRAGGEQCLELPIDLALGLIGDLDSSDDGGRELGHLACKLRLARNLRQPDVGLTPDGRFGDTNGHVAAPPPTPPDSPVSAARGFVRAFGRGGDRAAGP